MSRLLLLLTLTFVCGCDHLVRDFVGNFKRGQVTSMFARYSPGSVQASGSQFHGAFTLQPSQQTVTGSQVKAVLSLNRN